MSDLWPELPPKKPTPPSNFRDYIANHAFVYSDRNGIYNLLDTLSLTGDKGIKRIVDNIVAAHETEIERIIGEDEDKWEHPWNEPKNELRAEQRKRAGINPSPTTFTGYKDKNGRDIYDGNEIGWGIYTGVVHLSDGVWVFGDEEFGLSPCNQTAEIINSTDTALLDTLTNRGEWQGPLDALTIKTK